VISVAAGTTAMAVGGARLLFRALERLPVGGSWLRRGVSELSGRGDRWITHSVDPIGALVTAGHFPDAPQVR
jgi:hypothetical protein